MLLRPCIFPRDEGADLDELKAYVAARDQVLGTRETGVKVIDEETGKTQADDHQEKLCAAAESEDYTQETRDRLGELCTLLK